ncbi:ABC transporter permease [Paracoccus litorisediminis]|uniref:ABC transporter permease subunit n=1 Tax=Paracoccus litorisediminis TaxID=2006130 RepID=A0A844HM41_9RHOB|nr:ABC transporter permease [Paracoccus litorisediminis]MTH60990.1 ABC transporter permease subunit [Paracoccus litorisediminis]
MTHSPRGGRQAGDLVLHVYMLLFFAYMFLPLIAMMLAGVNDYSPPSITVWKGFTLRWFSALWQDARMWSGLANSLMIAGAVVALSLPMGLAGALLLSKLGRRSAGLLYIIMVSPLLTPGLIIGIATVTLWSQLGVSGGVLTAILAQSAFISAYAMLMFMARLQRQDITLEEAALDLGATPARAFRRITLPFLRPTMISAAVIAFLQSFENYNTTIFSIGGDHTLVTEIGARMRFGISPMINAIGIIFVALTVICAVLWGVLRKRGIARQA